MEVFGGESDVVSQEKVDFLQEVGGEGEVGLVEDGGDALFVHVIKFEYAWRK